MENATVPRLSKWPFVVSDVVLVGFAALLLYCTTPPWSPWLLGLSGLAVLAGAWLSVTPFLTQYRAAVQLTETAGLLTTIDQIKNVEMVGNQIREATGSWQAAHELAQQTTQAAKAISERMAAEAKAFTEFLQKANDAEKGHLRLEVEKQRRAEGEWLQITTALLDHVHALYQAAVRSGQPGLVEQLGHFQGACRDVVRRVGLVPFAAERDEPFDARAHQLLDSQTTPDNGARVSQTLATGYTYQGQLLRRALVALQPPEANASLSKGDRPTPVAPVGNAAPDEVTAGETPPVSAPAGPSDLPTPAPLANVPPPEQQLF